MAHDPNDIVTIRHEGVEVPGTATREAAETVWAALGWFIDEDTLPATPTGDPDQPPAVTAPPKNESAATWEAFLTAAQVPHDPAGTREEFIKAWEAHNS